MYASCSVILSALSVITMNLFLKSVCIIISVNVCLSITESPTTQASVDYHTRHPVADNNQFPYMVYIYMEVEGLDETFFLCGGVILDKNHVLTSASCFVNSPSSDVEVSFIYITAGSNAQPDTTYTYKIVTFDIMKGYSTTGYINDLIMLQISPDFVFSSQISPIAVGDSWNDVSDICTFPTWFDGTDWDYLYWQNIGQFDCARTDSLLYCAGDPTQHTAVTTRDDVGGPMVCNNRLVGLVTQNEDSQYLTNITEHYNWIQEHLGQKTTTEASSTSPVLTTVTGTTLPGTSPLATASPQPTTMPGTSSQATETVEPTAATGTSLASTATPEPTTAPGTSLPATATAVTTTVPGTSLPATATAVPTTEPGTSPQATATAEPTTVPGTLLPATATAVPITETGTSPQTTAMAEPTRASGTSPLATATAVPTTESGTLLTSTETHEPTITPYTSTPLTAEPITGTGTFPPATITPEAVTETEPTRVTETSPTTATSEPFTLTSTTVTETSLESTRATDASPETTVPPQVTTVPPTTTTQGHSSSCFNGIVNWYMLMSAVFIVATNAIVHAKII